MLLSDNPTILLIIGLATSIVTGLFIVIPAWLTIDSPQPYFTPGLVYGVFSFLLIKAIVEYASKSSPGAWLSMGCLVGTTVIYAFSIYMAYTVNSNKS